MAAARDPAEDGRLRAAERSGVELGGGEGGYGADLLEELEGVEFVPMLDQLAVGDAPDVDRVQLDLGPTRWDAEELAGVAATER